MIKDDLLLNKEMIKIKIKTWIKIKNMMHIFLHDNKNNKSN